MTGIPLFEDQSRDSRTLPLNAAPIPATLADDGHQVIAFAFVPARPGHKPNQAIAVVRKEGKPIERAYIAYRVAASQGGEWVACGGTHDCSYVNAMEIFMEEINGRV